jgi:hypothetical protein
LIDCDYWCGTDYIVGNVETTKGIKNKDGSDFDDADDIDDDTPLTLVMILGCC